MFQQLRPSLSLAALLLLAACSDPVSVRPLELGFDPEDPAWIAPDGSCGPSAPAVPLPAARRDSLPPPPARPDMNDQWAAIAREVPGGWGGLLYVDDRLTIVLVEPDQRGAAIRALQRHFSGDPRIASDLSTAQVRRGRWDFAQLYDWYRYLQPHVWSVEGVQSTDIDEATNRLEFGVLSEEAREELRERLAALDIPCFLVASEIEPPIQLRSR